jgi:uncharacterized protein
MSKIPTLNVMLKPAGSGCNLSCEYCFLDADAKKTRLMDRKTLQNTIEKASDFAENVKVIFHGGEPTLAGLDFFEEAMEIETSCGTKFSNVVQSNFILVDEKWADFFKEHNFKCGTSLDGMKEIHDSLRHYPDGRGTFDRVIHGIRLLEGRKADVGILLTLSKPMIGREAEIYAFMRSLGHHWQINLMGRTERQTDKSRYALTSDEIAYGTIQLFDRYIIDSANAPRIGSLDEVVAELIKGAERKLGKRNDRKKGCQNTMIGIDSDGSAYPCIRTDENLYYGNINEDSFDDIFANPIKQKAMQRSPETVESCNGCEYKLACTSGCVFEAYKSCGDIYGKDVFCEANKKIFGHVVDVLSMLFEKLRSGNNAGT